MENQETHYRDWLKQEFSDRCRRNSRYSLRAFARDLQFLPSRLSDVLNGKQGLSAKTASQLAQRLGLSPQETQKFVAMVEAEDARSGTKRALAQEQLEQMKTKPSPFQRLDDDVFAVISDWHHFALLELVSLEGFKPNRNWISRRFGISPIEAEVALRRCLKLGLLKKEGRRLIPTHVFPAAPSDVSSRAIKKFHSQILEKAGNALYLQALEEREFSANTMAIDPQDLPEMKRELKAFRRQFEQKYKKAKSKRAVYCLSLQFFSLTTELLRPLNESRRSQ
jgi:uncharacterized protein (TIGR02147 family)